MQGLMLSVRPPPGQKLPFDLQDGKLHLSPPERLIYRSHANVCEFNPIIPFRQMREEIDWDWASFLGRPLRTFESTLARSAVAGRRVLITGAGGSIGSELAYQVLKGIPANLVLCDSSEYALYKIYRRLSVLPEARKTRIVALLGDVLARRSLRQTFRLNHPDLVFHAAAYKHVSMLESNFTAAILNNAVGSMSLVREVTEQGDCQLVLLSTDKAVRPESIMGLSKRLAEMAVLSHSQSSTPMCVVRLCNVLGSSGSVVPLFKEQLESGAALTITHNDAKRCFITSAEAATALLSAATLRLDGKVLIPGCGEPLRVLQLASHMTRRYAETRGPLANPSVGNVFVGLRAGEKLVEEMVAISEALEFTLDSGERIFASPCPQSHQVESVMNRLEQQIYSCDSETMLASIRELIPNDRATGRPSEA
jgi:FlaA1/EpsC-like NDP-sugar epimerase